jgi:hypothetical protein
MKCLFKVLTHIKETYLYYRRGINESVSDFCLFYNKNHVEPIGNIEIGKIMSLLGIKAFHKTITCMHLNRKKTTSVRWYYISYEELDLIFDELRKASQDN